MTHSRDLQDTELDILKEVANIGAGHAATALSQLTGQRVVIDVPKVATCTIDEAADVLGDADALVAAIFMQVLGDLTGQSVVLFPRDSMLALIDMLLNREPGTTKILSEIEQSSIKETANIVCGAYLNALSDFLKLMLIPSVPRLTVDICRAVLSANFLDHGQGRDGVVILDTRFRFEPGDKSILGRFVLLPDSNALDVIMKAVGLA
jgi:chemotaxis protein CheC